MALYLILNENSHLMGIFYRTIRMMENGIKPLYVFDGKPPEMKSGEVHLISITPDSLGVVGEESGEEGRCH